MTSTDVVALDLTSDAPLHHCYVDPAVIEIIGSKPTHIFDLGCGNGVFARTLTSLGHEVVGVDPSAENIRIARAAAPALRLEEGHAYEPLALRFGSFPVVVSLEVIGHVLWPRKFIATCRDLLQPGGTLILSTPYHGYGKNLLIALFGRCDTHYDPLSDPGPFKFWSERTLRKLLEEADFRNVRYRRVGRFGPLARSMIASAVRG